MTQLNGFEHAAARKDLLATPTESRKDRKFFAVPMAHPFFTTQFTADQGEHFIAGDLSTASDFNLKGTIKFSRSTTEKTAAFSHKSHGVDPTLSRTRLTNQVAALPGFAYTEALATLPATDGVKTNVSAVNVYVLLVGSTLVTLRNRTQIVRSANGTDYSAFRHDNRPSTTHTVYESEAAARDAMLALMRAKKFGPAVFSRDMDKSLSVQFSIPLSGDLVSIPLNKGDVTHLNKTLESLRAREYTYKAARDNRTNEKIHQKNYNELSAFAPYFSIIKNITLGIQRNLPKTVQMVLPKKVHVEKVVDSLETQSTKVGMLTMDQASKVGSWSNTPDLEDLPATAQATLYFPQLVNGTYGSLATVINAAQSDSLDFSVHPRFAPGEAYVGSTHQLMHDGVYSATSDDLPPYSDLELYATSGLDRFFDMLHHITVIDKNNVKSYNPGVYDKII